MKYLVLLLCYIIWQTNSNTYFAEESEIVDLRCILVHATHYTENGRTYKRVDTYYEARCKEDEYCFDINSRYRKNHQGDIHYLYICLKKHRLLDTGEKCIKNIYPDGIYEESDICLEGSCINNICQKNIVCNSSNWYCGPKQRCDFSSNKCEKLKGENESCSDSDECDIGLICADRGNTFMIIKTCIKIGSLKGNEICKDREACKSGEVYAQKCVEPDIKNNINHRLFAKYLEKFYKNLEEVKNNKRYAPFGVLRYTLNNKEIADQYLIYQYKNFLLEHKIIDEKGVIDEKVRWKINCIYSDFASSYIIQTEPYEKEKGQNNSINEEKENEENVKKEEEENEEEIEEDKEMKVKEEEKVDEKKEMKLKEEEEEKVKKEEIEEEKEKKVKEEVEEDNQSDSEESKKENEERKSNFDDSLDNGKKGYYESKNDKLGNKTKENDANENISSNKGQSINNSKFHLYIYKIILFIIILFY